MLIEQAAKELWPNYRAGETGGDDPGEPWEYIVYLGFPIRLNLDSADIHEPAWYGINYIIGFQPLNDRGHDHIRDRYGSIEAFVTDVAIEVVATGSKVTAIAGMIASSRADARCQITRLR